MVSEKRYNALRYNRNFSKLNVEFLLFALARNIQYIFLILESMALLGLSHFNVRVRYLPDITMMGEWHNFVSHGYNPFWLYYHFLELFFTVAKNIGLYMYDTIRHNSIQGLIICFLIVSIWLAYSGMSYGYSRSESRGHNAFWSSLKKLLFTSNLVERSLWMIFFIEMLGFVLTPAAPNIIFLVVVWLLVLSVKATPIISNFIVDLTNHLEKSVLHSEYVLWAVTAIDVLLVYFDSSRAFAFWIMVILYCAIAQGVFYAVKDSSQLSRWAKYLFNLGVFVFFFSIVVVYFAAFVITNIFLSPLWLYYFWTKRKPLPHKWIEYATMAILIGLLVYYFK
ncbi:MAG: hypothetical protein KJ574_01565 [Nanoarchaeota archaeon]|nr:hypothetical protein [Nanoarchaeota archaeon]